MNRKDVLKAQLGSLVRSMRAEGLLTDQFREEDDVNLTSILRDCVRIKSCTERCMLAVAKLREEQHVLFGKLEEVVELESRIITHGGH